MRTTSHTTPLSGSPVSAPSSSTTRSMSSLSPVHDVVGWFRRNSVVPTITGAWTFSFLRPFLCPLFRPNISRNPRTFHSRGPEEAMRTRLAAAPTHAFEGLEAM